MKRNGGVVNGLTLNAQLTVKLSVFSRLQSLINQSSGFCGTASRRCPLSRLVEVRKHPLALMLRRPAGSRRNEPGLRRSASPAYQSHPCAWPMDRSFISEPVRIVRHGRVAPEVCGIVGQSESGSGPACVSSRGMGWSSVRVHLAGEDDSLVSVRPVLDRAVDFAAIGKMSPY
jgi:hypothetical protein